MQLGRVDEIDAFREAVIAVHQENWRLLQAAAESYLERRRALRLHRRRQVPSRPASRRRTLRRLVRARSVPRLAAPGPGAGSRADRPRSRRGRPLPADARPGPDGQPGRRRLLAAPEPHAARCPARLRREPVLALGRPASPAHPSSPTGRRSITGFPRASRRPRTTASAGGGRSPRPPRPTPACSTRHASTWPVSCSASSAPRRSRARTRRRTRPTAAPEASGPYALDTLADDETIARLATGIKRFKLPDEFNPIKIYQAIADDPKTGQGEEALDALATIFENRRQFDRAADYLKRSREIYGDKDDGSKTQQIDQILGAWGQFDADADPARRPGSHGRLPLPQRPPRPFRGARDPRRQAPEGRQGLHRLQRRSSSTGSRSISTTSAPAWSA